MIQTTLAYEKKRQTGQPPQLGVFIQLINTTLVLAAAGVAGLDAGELYLADGSRLADGSITAGTDVQTVHRGLLSADALVEGDESGGNAVTGGLVVLPSRRTTTRIEVDNATGLIAEMLDNEPFVGKRVQYRLLYPGLVATDMPTRFAGEIFRETVTAETAVFEMRSA